MVSQPLGLQAGFRLPKLSPGDALLHVILFLIATRPIIDLFGRYQGTGINPGGALGVLTALLIGLRVLIGPWKLPRFLVPAISLFALLLGTALVSLVWRGLPDVASWGRFLVGFSPLLLLPALQGLAHEPRERLLRRTVLLLLACSLVPVVIAWLQILGVVSFTYFDYYAGGRVGRPSGGYFQPNSLGRLMVFAVLFTVLLWWKNGLARHRAALLIGLFSTTAFISTHRTSILSLAFVVAVLLGYEVANRKRIRRRQLRYMLALGIGISLACLTFATTPPGNAVLSQLETTTDVIVSAFSTATPDAIGEGRFLRGRGQVWADAVSHYASSDPAARYFGLGYEPLEAHNDILRVLLMHGALGVVGFFGVFLALLAWGLSATDSRGRAGVVALYTFFFLFGITLHPTGYPFFMWLFFLAMACSSTFFPRHQTEIASERRGLR